MLYKRLTRLAPFLLSLLLFGISLWAITQELRKYNPQDVVNSLMAIPKPHLIMAIALTLVSYILFTGYDALAIYHLRQSLPYRRTALVAIISYAISNSVGFALLSGSAIRYRFYSAWGFSAAKIAQIIAFCNLSFWLGFFAVGGVIFALQPIATPELLNIPFESVRPIGYIFLGIIAAYLLWSGLSQKPFKIKKLVFPHLPVKLSLIQISLTSLDWMLAAGVLYVLLPVPKQLSYFNFFGIYLLGQLAGIISNVPGGLGIFETVLVLLLAPVISADRLLGALLAYRGVYYFLPLGISLLMLGLYELKLQSNRLLS
ncbi:MAG: lysylphosphatidylglycerol synthase domain-containing protein [Waterburya sp.]